MLAAQACRLHFARRPVELLSQTQPSRTGHRPQRGELFGTGLFIRPHGLNMSQRDYSCKSGLVFIRPRTEEEMTFEAPLPKDFREALKFLCSKT
jgi:hypothetical protein